MLSRLLLKKPILTASLALTAQVLLGQVQISGAGTITDSLGKYYIKLSSDDSIYFSYLGRSTAKYPVKDIPQGFPFDMSLEVAVDSLPSVFVRSHNYREDSLENRKDYQKIFDYGADYVDNMKAGRRGGAGVGLDFDLLLSGRKNRRMLAFRQRLEEEEKDKYIDHRFTKAIVKRVTGGDSTRSPIQTAQED